MSLLSWNYWRLGNHRTVNSLKNVIKVQAPKIVFLMETKSCKGWMEEVCDECGFKNRLIIPSDGFSGDLTLLWKKEVTIHVQTYSMSHIDAFVNEGEEIGWSHFIGFYDNPDAAKRYESWTLLKSLRGVSQLPWMALVTSMSLLVYQKRRVEGVDLLLRWLDSLRLLTGVGFKM